MLDQEVLDKLRSHHPDAAKRLIEVFGDRLYGLCLRILSSEEAAHEVMQETFLTVWRKWPTFAGKSKFSSWIYRIGANFSYMKLRKQRRYSREISIEMLAAPDQAEADIAEGKVDPPKWHGAVPTPDEAATRTERLRLIAGAMNRLTPTYRTAYMLKDIEGLSIEEIAEIMDLSKSAVKTRVHRARLMMRKTLEPILKH